MNAKKLYLGLDLGTDSCGWALTNEQYNIVKKGNKALWGVRLFDAASTAKERRMKRSNRRRLDRKKFRIGLLQELFAQEVYKVDPLFFLRLNSSFFQIEDKTVGKYSLFNDKEYTDKEFLQRFPTIYHLRLYLMNATEKPDIRWVYLACHHIIKYRGNFLMENKEITFGKNDSEYVYSLLEQTQEVINGYLEEEIVSFPMSLEAINNVLSKIESEKSPKKISEYLSELLISGNSKVEKAIVKAISGLVFTLSELYSNDEFVDFEKNKVSFSDEKYDEEYYPIISDFLGDDVELVDLLKQIHDYFILRKLLRGKNSLSEAMVSIFNEHKADLFVLKRLMRKYASREQYFQLFRSSNTPGNYASYVRSTTTNNITTAIHSKCSIADFHKYVKKMISALEISDKDEDYEYIKAKIESGTFLLKQKNKQNAIFPFQINKFELEKILSNAEIHYPFLAQNDVAGWSVTQKIVSLLTFRIPYYVGPLNNHHGLLADKYHSWVVRKESGGVTPWNYQEKIDEIQSEERFILRMTNKCTYLKGVDVIPKNSLLYSEFTLLNEINAMKIRGEKISTDVKKLMIDKLIKKQKKITKKSILRFLKAEGITELASPDDITGIDDPIKGNLSSYISFTKIFGEITPQNREMIEHIIFNLSIFEDSKTAVNRSRREFPVLTSEQLKQIKGLSYQGFGTLSRELLQDEIYFVDGNGEAQSIISLMRENSMTFMEVLYDSKYHFLKKIEEFNEGKEDNSSWKKSIENSYTSPGMKRSIIQAMLVVEELKKIVKRPIDRFFVECTREHGKKERTNSRKKQIESMYKQVKLQASEMKDLLYILHKKTDLELRSDKLFLYFMQLGKCMYTGMSIDLDNLASFDIDHIVPQSLLKDDSIDNRVLVWGNANKDKGDIYPLRNDIQRQNLAYWKHLYSLNLISPKKLDLLTRQYELTDEEIGSFINRQLVFTNQSVKVLAEVLRKTNPDSQIIYSKARNVSDFRDEFNLLKSREINDFHHADDAFLNIVVGNTFFSKFGFDARLRVPEYRKEKESLNVKKIFNHNVIGAWKSDGSSISFVKGILKRHDRLVTERTYDGTGEFFNATLYPKSEGLIPLKNSIGDPRIDTSKYGGYNSLGTAFFCVVNSIGKKDKNIVTIESVPILHAKQIKDIPSLEKYLIQVVGLKNPKVVIPHLSMNTLMSYDDSLVRIVSNVSGRRLGVNISTQMNSNEFINDYARIISKHKESIDSIDSISSYDYSIYVVTKSQDKSSSKDKILTASDNIRFFDIIVDHMKKPFFNGLSNMISTSDKLIASREEFMSFNVRVQAYLLFEMLHLVQNNGTLSKLALLSQLSENSGKHMINQNVTSNRIKIIDQSVTGYYESIRWSNQPNAF